MIPHFTITTHRITYTPTYFPHCSQSFNIQHHPLNIPQTFIRPWNNNYTYVQMFTHVHFFQHTSHSTTMPHPITHTPQPSFHTHTNPYEHNIPSFTSSIGNSLLLCHSVMTSQNKTPQNNENLARHIFTQKSKYFGRVEITTKTSKVYTTTRTHRQHVPAVLRKKGHKTASVGKTDN